MYLTERHGIFANHKERNLYMGETFTGLADRYEAWFVNNKELFQSELKLLKDVIPPFSSGLEIGVGTGIFAEALGISKGVEPSEEMAARAEERGIQVYRGKGEDLAFENNSFDLLVMITVDCFLSDLDKTLREAHRILIPGGSLALGFIDKTAPLGKIYEEKKQHNEFYRHANFHTGEEILCAIEKAGFEIIKRRQTIFTLENEFQDSKEGLGEGLFGVVLAGKPKMSNIILIGMPGCGKSTIGVVLAKAMGYQFIDCDLLIQKNEGKMLSELIEANGVKGFHEIENRVISSIDTEKTVIATGGSAIYGKDAMAHLREIGWVIYLKLPYEEIEERLGDLHQRGITIEPGETLRNLYDQRVPLYEKYAHDLVDTQGLLLRESVAKIQESLKNTI